MVVLGGAKVTDKIALIDRFLDEADSLLIGGAMSFAFFRAQGMPTGSSLVEEEGVELARKALDSAEGRRAQLLLPQDLVAGTEFSADTELTELDGVEVPDGLMGLDVGPKTADGLRRGDRRRGHGVLERADGRVRARAVRGRHPRAWPRRWPRPRAPPWWAAATRRRRSPSSAWPTGSTTSPPAAAPRWSCSRAASCPGWRRSMTRRPYVCGNWKLWGTRAEALSYCERLPGLLGDDRPADVGVCVPFTALDTVVSALRGHDIRVAAQNMAAEDNGAFTGEVSRRDAAGAGRRLRAARATPSAGAVRRDRRRPAGQAAQGARARACSPILCVGETEDEREAGDTERKLRHQVRRGAPRTWRPSAWAS